MTAVLDPTGTYRYRLARDLDALGGEGTLLFVMLNPSTADADLDDHTIRRCRKLTAAEGYARLEVVNLFAYRSKDPVTLRFVDDPVGPENDAHIEAAARDADRIVAAWSHVERRLRWRVGEVMRLIDRIPRDLHVFGLTATGSPRHPSRLPDAARLTRWGTGPARP